MTIKFVTFNVENLFTRPKAMNLSDINLGIDKLDLIAQLQAELRKSVYNEKQIVQLANKARGYFKVNKTRGKTPLSYSKKIESYRLGPAKGRGDWEGFIELTRAQFSSQSVANTGKFVDKLNPDIIGICEVENLTAMRKFRSQYLSRERLRYEILIDGNDPRGIDVGLYSKLPLGTLRTNIHYRPTVRSHPLFPRDCMEVEIPMANNESLWVLQTHLKSKLGKPDTSNKRRKAQACRIAAILAERYNLENQWVIVAGDFNDTPDSKPLKPLVKNQDLFDVLDIADVPVEQRWTYSYRGDKNQIDYVLVSRALKDKVAAAGVDRSGIAEIAKLTDGAEQPMDGITNWRNAASDHGAIWVELDIAPPNTRY